MENKLLRALIVDDEEMSRATIAHFVKKHEYIDLVDSCENAMEAITHLNSGTIDLVFLDIEMPEMSGLELLKVLKKPPLVILVTSKKEYAVEAFEHQVVDYLVKPVEYTRFVKAVQRAQSLHESENVSHIEDDDIYIKSDYRIIRVQLSDIKYIEAMADYANIYLPDSRHIIHSTMKALEQKLPSENFIRVHRSYIINLREVESIEDNMVKVNGKNIPIGSSYKDKFMSKIKLF